MNAPKDNIDLPAANGATLHVRRRLAATARGVVQINHDLGEHGGRYDDFARHLASKGIHVYTPDHRGHGQTSASDTPPGGLAGTATIDGDLFDLHELIAREHPGLPVVIFGQGAGALISAHFLLGHAPRLAGAALWNMPVATDYATRFLGAMLRWERFRLGSDVTSPTMARIVRGWERKAGGGGESFAWLSDDPDALEAYLADPACGREPTIGAWIAILRMMSQAGRTRAWEGLPDDLPLHLAAGGADPTTNRGAMVEDFTRHLKRAGFSNLVSRRYPEQRHDLVNGLNRDVIRRDFVEWLEALAGSTARP